LLIVHGVVVIHGAHTTIHARILLRVSDRGGRQKIVNGYVHITRTHKRNQSILTSLTFSCNAIEARPEQISEHIRNWNAGTLDANTYGRDTCNDMNQIHLDKHICTSKADTLYCSYKVLHSTLVLPK
jgi:hypothetical protein